MGRSYEVLGAVAGKKRANAVANSTLFPLLSQRKTDWRILTILCLVFGLQVLDKNVM